MRAYIQCRGGRGEGGGGRAYTVGVIGLNFFVYRWMGLYMGHFFMVELISGSLHYGTCKSKVVYTDYQIIVFSFIDDRKCHNFGKNVLDQCTATFLF